MDVRRWFVFTIVCIVTMLDFGIIFSLGAMFVAMVETFQSDRSSTATVQSLLVGISLSFSVLSGALITKFGIRTVAVVSSILVPFGFCVSFFVKDIHVLYFTISITSGIGISSIHLISVVVIQEMFPTVLQALCFAIHGVAVNIAGIVYPFIIGLLLEKYGVNGTFLILGGIFMNSFLIPILLLKSEEKYKVADNEQKLLNETEKGGKDSGESSSKDVNDTGANECLTSESGQDLEKNNKLKFSTLFTKQFIFLLTASALCIPALNTFLAITVDIFVWKGFTPTQGIFSFVPFNVLSLLAKFIPVITKKLIKRLSCFSLPVIFCVCGLLSQFLIYFARSYIIMLVGASITGLALGGVFPAMLIAGAKIVRKEEWPFASGLLMTVIGIISSCLGPLFGAFRDRTGSYSGAVLTIGSLQAAGAMLYLLGLTSRRNDMIEKKGQLTMT